MKVDSLIEFKDYPKGIWNFTPEQEDEKFGDLKTFSEDSLKFVLSPYLLPKEDKRFYVRTPELVWDGWYAAFIESKRAISKTEVDIIPEFKKRRVEEPIVISVGETGDDMEEDSEDDLDEKPLKHKKEFAVAILAYKVVLHFFRWSKFAKQFGETKCEEVVDHLFACAVKFALDIFDEEDFQRMCYGSEIRDEHTRLYEYMFEKGYQYAVVNVDKARPHLWESDIYDALFLKVHSYPLKQLKPMECETVMDNLKEHHYSKARELIEAHIPLKGHLKAQLMLELANLMCFHVTDVLILQAIHRFDLQGLLADCGIINEEQKTLISDLKDAIFAGFGSLTHIKASELLKSRDNFTASVYNEFGPCKSEVMDVIKLANHERRWSNERFIKADHFLRALSLSRVRDHLEKMTIDPEECLRVSSSDLYTYQLCSLSFHLARNIHGVEGKWGLEYLVFAFLFGSSKEKLAECFTGKQDLFNSLTSCESQYSVPSWRNFDVFMVLMGKRARYGENVLCRGNEVVKKLQEEVHARKIKLPHDDDLRERWEI